MRGHRYVYNRLYRWDEISYPAGRPWISTCDCTAGWRGFHKTWRDAYRAAYRHHCPIVITIG